MSTDRLGAADTVLVVPCYNEEHRIDLERIDAFSDSTGDVRITFVDDGSTDHTAEILSAFAAKRPDGFDLVRIPKNVGKAEAVRRGILHSLEVQPRYVGYWDADLSTPLSEVFGFREILSARPSVEMVFGSRVKLMGRTIVRSELRHYLGRVFATAASMTLHLPIYDTQCGAKLFRASPHIANLFNRPFLTEWLFDVEIVARYIAARAHLEGIPTTTEAIYEYPLTEWVHVSNSKVGIGTFARAGFDLLRILSHYELYRRYDQRAKKHESV